MKNLTAAAAAVWASIVRTLVPMTVGGILGWAATHNLTLDDQAEASLTSFLTILFGGVYFVLARVLETYVAPKFGWLLGLAKSPDGYSKESPKDQA